MFFGSRSRITALEKLFDPYNSDTGVLVKSMPPLWQQSSRQLIDFSLQYGYNKTFLIIYQQISCQDTKKRTIISRSCNSLYYNELKTGHKKHLYPDLRKGNKNVSFAKNPAKMYG
jgi:hypothetical protein